MPSFGTPAGRGPRCSPISFRHGHARNHHELVRQEMSSRSRHPFSSFRVKASVCHCGRRRPRSSPPSALARAAPTGRRRSKGAAGPRGRMRSPALNPDLSAAVPGSTSSPWPAPSDRESAPATSDAGKGRARPAARFLLRTVNGLDGVADLVAVNATLHHLARVVELRAVLAEARELLRDGEDGRRTAFGRQPGLFVG